MIRRLIILLLIVGCVFAREPIVIIDFEGINVRSGEAKALTQRLTTEMVSPDPKMLEDIVRLNLGETDINIFDNLYDSEYIDTVGICRHN